MTARVPSRQARRVGSLRLALAAVATIAALVTVPASATAQEDSDPDHLMLVEQTPWVVPGGSFAMQVRVDDPPDGAQLRWSLHGAVRTRSEYARTLDGRSLRGRIARATADLDELTEADGAYSRRIVTGPVTGEDVNAEIGDTEEGVYPVVVELLDEDDAVVDTLVTHLVRLPEPNENESPIDAVVVVPVHAPPSHTGPGEVDGSLLTPFHVTADALLAHPGAAVTIAPTPEALAAAVEADPTAASRLDELAEGREVLADTWVRLEPRAWRRVGLGDELARQQAAAKTTVSQILGTTPRSDVAVLPPGGGSGAVEAVVADGADVVLVPEADLQPLDEDDFIVTLTRPFLVQAGGGTVDALMVDAGLAAHVGSTGDPVLDAHHLLADLAVLALDAPLSQRAAVVVLDDSASVDRGFLEALLDGLDQVPREGAAPLVQAVGIEEVIADVAPAGEDGGIAGDDEEPLVRTVIGGEGFEPTTGLRDSLVSARDAVATYRSVFGDDETVAEADELILTAGAASLTPAERDRLLATAVDPLRASFDAIHGPREQTVRFTAREGQVQLVLGNDTGRPASVVIELRGDRLEFPDRPDGRLEVELQPGTNRIDLDVRARSSGDARLDLRLVTPDGRIELGQSRVTVRTTAFSGVGLVLMAAAALFLIVWWTRTILRERGTRKERHPAHAR